MTGCSNGLIGKPPCRTLMQAMIDMSWPLKKRVEFLYEVYGDKGRAMPSARALSPSDPSHEDVSRPSVSVAIANREGV
jgi:hypothetical protein